MNNQNGQCVWLRLDVVEARILELIFAACLEAGGDEDMIAPLASMLKRAKAQQELRTQSKDLG